MPRKCFFLKNVWLSLSTCYCGLTSLFNVHGCFPPFHNGSKKLCIVTWSVKICKIHESFSSTEFLYFKHMVIVSESKWTEKFVLTVSSACKKNVIESIIWEKELGLFQFMFKWLFICLFMTLLKIIDVVLSTRFCILLLRKIWHDCSTS